MNSQLTDKNRGDDSSAGASCGILYVATASDNPAYIQSAIRSAISAKCHMPEIPIHLYTDDVGSSAIALLDKSPFNSVARIKNPHRRSKIDCLLQTPFERTLFLDADTYVLRNVQDLFVLLNQFDLALSHGIRRAGSNAKTTWREDLPSSFPMHSSGVMCYRLSEGVEKMLSDWQNAYRDAGFSKDQITLRELLWNSNARFAVLPPEYNIRYPKYLGVWEPTEAEPAILHFASLLSSERSFGARFRDRSRHFLRRIWATIRFFRHF